MLTLPLYVCVALRACWDVHLCDVSVLLLPVLQRLLQVLLPQSLDGSDLELVVRQQLSEFLWRHTHTHIHTEYRTRTWCHLLLPRSRVLLVSSLALRPSWPRRLSRCSSLAFSAFSSFTRRSVGLSLITARFWMRLVL